MIDPASTLALLIGGIGSWGAESQDELDAKHYAELRKKMSKANLVAKNRGKKDLALSTRQNKAGLVATNERILGQNGMLGTSAGQSQINQGLASMNKSYNTSVADLDTKYLNQQAEIDGMVAPPEQSDDDLFAQLLGLGLKGSMNSLDGLFGGKDQKKAKKGMMKPKFNPIYGNYNSNIGRGLA